MQVMLRRNLLRAGLALAPAALKLKAAAAGWDMVPEILGRIRPPRFPDREFPVARYGGAGDGRTDCRAAFEKAIAACAAAGGGRVTVPAGAFLSNGPIRLKSNVNLHLAEGATIRFGTDPADYLPAVLIRWEGTMCYNYSPLIYAYRQQNIAITGRGTIDGQTERFWAEWRPKHTPDQEAIREMNNKGVEVKQRVLGAGHFLRPSLILPYECRNLLFEGVTLKSSPYWNLQPTFCENVTVRGLHILRGTTNDDGCDPDSCRDVLIEDCVFDTEDDHIAIKAGRDREGRESRPCENIVVRRCKGVHTKANGYCIGSEMSGGVRNVFIEDCTVGEAGNALCVKANSDRGGTVENIWIRRVTAESCDCAIRLETDYKGVVGHPYPPRYRDLHFEDVRCGQARKTGIYSVGLAARPISGVYFERVAIPSAGEATRIAFTTDIRMRNTRINGTGISR